MRKYSYFIVRGAKVLFFLVSLVFTTVFFTFLKKISLFPKNLIKENLSFHSRQILSSLGVEVKTRLEDSINFQTPTVLLSNHISYLDILVYSSLGKFDFLAKSEVAAWPLIGNIASSCGTLFVKRSSLLSRAMMIKVRSKQLRRQNFKKQRVYSDSMGQIHSWMSGRGREVVCI